MKSLERELEKIFGRPATSGGGSSARPFFYAGYEERRDWRTYQWHGLARNDSGESPRLLFQYTLDGRGFFRHGRKRWSTGPGCGFFALLPSDHSYGLPRDSPSWRFVWVIFHHDYIVSRLGAYLRTRTPVRVLPEESGPIRTLPALLRGIHQPERPPPGDATSELACLSWMLRAEHFLREMDHPGHDSDPLIESLRTRVIGALPRALDVNELARSHHMSRSAYSHHFRARTGSTPARVMLEIRLQESEKRLRSGNEKIDAIARACGFADANHFCKVFRRERRITPGAFRRLLGPANQPTNIKR